jgi:TDG/mug DNA glycosylase family protein
MSDLCHSFPPVAKKNAVILILGALPSVLSLEKCENYGNPQNHFWRLVYALFGKTPDEEYEKKTAFLYSKKIALWDSIASANRRGSLDGAIKNVVPNDFDSFFVQHTHIKHVFFNGAKSEAVFKKHFPHLCAAVPHTRLPSSSPIPTSKIRNFEQKLAAWSVVKNVWDELNISRPFY